MTNLALFTPPMRQNQARTRTGLTPFGDLFETFFNDTDLFKSMPSGADLILRPSLDIAESDKEYVVSIEVPGVDEKDIKIDVENRTLTISGEKKRESEEEGKNWHRVERSYGSFQRALALPEDVDQDSIEAMQKHGVLTVKMPRHIEANANKKTIRIKKS